MQTNGVTKFKISNRQSASHLGIKQEKLYTVATNCNVLTDVSRDFPTLAVKSRILVIRPLAERSRIPVIGNLDVKSWVPAIGTIAVKSRIPFIATLAVRSWVPVRDHKHHIRGGVTKNEDVLGIGGEVLPS